MERVRPIVLIERIFFPVEPELRMPDPVAIPANDGAKIGVGLVEIFSDAVIAEDHVSRGTVACRGRSG